MTEKSLNYVVGILKGEEPQGAPEWYETLGFLYAHRIAGLFYARALKKGAGMPLKVRKLLSDTFEAQKRRVEYMRGEIEKISEALEKSGAEYIFLKGSALCNVAEADCAVYEDGERASNDIDILVKPDGITSAVVALEGLGYKQGRYDAEQKQIVPFTRLERLTRRMNRGEIAPMLKETGNPELPCIEVDINFSLSSEPNGEDALLVAMIDGGSVYKGKVALRVPTEEMFFLHLILHQYKEGRLYFMVARSKDLDLYKLADMYYLWKGDLFDKEKFKELAERYGLKSKVGAVLETVGRVFGDAELTAEAEKYGSEPQSVYDYAQRKSFRWTADERTRLLHFDGRTLLKEEEAND